MLYKVTFTIDADRADEDENISEDRITQAIRDVVREACADLNRRANQSSHAGTVWIGVSDMANQMIDVAPVDGDQKNPYAAYVGMTVDDLIKITNAVADEACDKIASEKKFEDALNNYLSEIHRIYNAYYKIHYPNLTTPIFSVERGSKWIRVVKNDESQKSVHSFVAAQDVTTKNLWAKKGDIMKAASWKLPAKHPRGSIFDQDVTDCMDQHGFVKYLK